MEKSVLLGNQIIYPVICQGPGIIDHFNYFAGRLESGYWYCT